MIKKLCIFTFLLSSTTFIHAQNFQKYVDYSKFYGIDLNDNVCAFGVKENDWFNNTSLAKMKEKEVFSWKFSSLETYKRAKCYFKLTELNYEQWLQSKREAGLNWDEIGILAEKLDKLIDACKKDIDIDDDFFDLFTSGPDWSGGKELMFATESIDISGLWHDEVCKAFPVMLTLTKSWTSEKDFFYNSEAELNEIIAVLKKTYGNPNESSSKGIVITHKWNLPNYTLICSRSPNGKVNVYYIVGNL
jgi:hypothetical protein